MNNNLSEQALKGVKWSYITTAVRFVLNLLTISVLAHLLIPGDFGVIALSIGFINILSTVSGLGIGSALIYHKNLNNKFIQTSFTLTLFLSIVFSLVLFFNASFLADFFKFPQAENIIKIMSFSIILINVNKVSYSLLQKNLKFKSIMISRTVSYFISYSLIGILLAVLGLGVWALVFAFISEKLLFLLINYFFFKYPVIPAIYSKELRVILRYGGGVTIGDLFYTLAREGDYFIVSRTFGMDTLGFYERAYKLARMVSDKLFYSLNRVLFPSFSILQDQAAKLRSVFIHSSNIIVLTGLPISALIMVVSPEIVNLLLGSHWVGAIPILKIFSLFIFLQMGIGLTSSLIKATGFVSKRAVYSFIYAVLVFLFAVIGSQWGISGLSMGVLFAVFIYAACLLYQCLQINNMTFLEYLRKIAGSVLFTLFFSLSFLVIIFFIRYSIQLLWLKFILICIISPCLYILCLYLFLRKMELNSLKWILTKLDIKMISKVVKIFFKD